MNINKYIKRLKIQAFASPALIGVLSLCCLSGCEDFLEEKNIPGMTAAYYETAEGIEAGVTSVYAYMRYGMAGEYTNLFTELGTDVTTGAVGAATYATNLYNSSLNASLSNFYGIWTNHYRAINMTNTILENLSSNSDLSAAKKKNYLGEMFFFRAYYYFDLVQQFGSIPLRTAVEDAPRTDYTRESVENIYKQIITDLRSAVDDLNETAASQGRATKYAAAHLLSKVYLTRGSAVTDRRGQQATDADSALYYAEMVINSGKYRLLDNFSDLWRADNYGNAEGIFAVQFTANTIYNGSGNLAHLYWNAYYEDLPGMIRDLTNGRPYRFHRGTNKTMFDLFDRKNDSRYHKSFKWVYYCNRPGTYTINGSSVRMVAGDTAIYYSIHPRKTDREYNYTYLQWDRTNLVNNNNHYPQLVKWLDPNRAAINDAAGNRPWVRMRLGETYLLAAEAAGRKGDFDKAAQYINVIRQRAAWHDGEAKGSQYWTEEGGAVNDPNSTFDEIKVTPDDLRTNFIDFILDERARELLGEYMRWEDLVRCEKLYEYVTKYNPDAASNIKEYHKLRPIPQSYIDTLNPAGTNEENQNEGYY